MKRLKNIIINLLLFCLTLTFVLLASEFCIRKIFPVYLGSSNERELFSMYDSGIGWINLPDKKGRLIRPDFDISVSINSRGLRDREYAYGKEEGTYRVLVLGDSFVWGYGVEQDERYSDILGARLSSAEVLNMGVSGYGQDQELLLLKRDGIKYQPDLVIVNVHFNSDVWNNVSSSSYGYHKPLAGDIREHRITWKNVPVPRDSNGMTLNKWLSGRLALWNYLKIRKAKGKLIEDYFLDVIDSVTNSENSEIFTSDIPGELMTCNLLDEIRSVALSIDAPLLAVLIPNILAGTQSIKKDIRLNRLRDCLKIKDISYLDLEPVFSNFFIQNPDKLLTFRHDRHWNPQGHKVVAEVVFQYFLKRKDRLNLRVSKNNQ